ncbi:MAG: hypothetical protein RR714_06685 [Aurantimicrobium sp.]
MARIDAGWIVTFMADMESFRNVPFVHDVGCPVRVTRYNTIMAVVKAGVTGLALGSTSVNPAGCTKSGVRCIDNRDLLHESLSGLLVVGFLWGNFRVTNGLALVAFWVSYAHWGSIGFQAAF